CLPAGVIVRLDNRPSRHAHEARSHPPRHTASGFSAPAITESGGGGGLAAAILPRSSHPPATPQPDAPTRTQASVRRCTPGPLADLRRVDGTGPAVGIRASDPLAGAGGYERGAIANSPAGAARRRRP